MSFSADVKKELAEQLPDRPCCRAAELYGLLEFGHAFSGKEISIQTEQESVADLYASLLKKVCSISSPTTDTVRRRTVLCRCAVEDEEERRTVLEKFGHIQQEISARLNRANLECDSCARSFLRGAFLSCGAVTDPSRDYHLEFSVPYYNLSHDLLTLMNEVGLRAKIVSRNGSYVVYLKESESIEDCLTYLGASHSALELMNVKMMKSIRNETNRRFNCENANMDKTVAAAGEQMDAIRRLEKSGRLATLPDEMQQMARLRMENPDLTLRELGEIMNPPLSRSGVNHRLQKLLAMATDKT